MRRLSLFLFIFSLLVSPAQASGFCSLIDMDVAKAMPAKITGSDHVYFVKNSTVDPACPSARPACREKTYLVPGNHVLAGATQGDFTCALYISTTGKDTEGWLPSKALAPETLPDQPLANWLGDWKRVEANIRITPSKKNGALIIKGEATYGSLDPDRVRRGAVNEGELNAEATPEHNVLGFTMHNDTTLPYDKGDDIDCRAQMHLFGKYLVVNDNGNCGGMNVRFTGIYHNKAGL